MPHSKPIAIYADTDKGALFFEGSTVEPKFLGTIVASVHPTQADRVVIQRTDRYEADGVTLRRVFRRLNIFRVVDTNGVFIADPIVDGGLGYDASSVVNYINSEANRTGAGTSELLFEKLDVIDFTRDESDTSILMSNGDHYGVNSIRAIEGPDGLCKIVPALSDTPELYSLAFDCAQINGTAANSLSNCVNQLNALFTVTALGGAVPAVTYTQDDGTDHTWNSEETETPAGGTAGTDFMYGSTNSQYHGPRIWTTETIDQPGEYYTFEAENVVAGGGPLLGIGLYSVDNGDLTEIADNNLSNSGHHGYFFSNWLYNYNGYTAPWTTYGSASSLSYGSGWNGAAADQFRYSDAHEAFRGGQTALFKCGITDEGFVGVWYYDVEVAGIDGAQGARSNDWILLARSSTPVPAGSYGLLLKLANTSVRIRSLPRRFATDPAAPTLFYRYIESPDGNFEYPLFATAAEADYVDTQNGGAGASDARVYVDEPTSTSWYSPVTGFEGAGTQAPVGGGAITYTEIATEADSNHVPPAFSAGQLGVTENQNLNYQTQPADTNYVTSVTGLPSGLSLTADGRIIGDAPFVAETTSFPVSVMRTNEFGTSTGVLDLVIGNDSVASAITGYTVYQGNTEAPSTICKDSHSLLQYDTQISPGEELTWIHANYAQIGILNASGEIAKDTSTTIADNTSNWFDLHLSLWTGALNHTSNLGVGWDNNSMISTGANAGFLWKLEYKSDGYICLYRNDSLILTSAGTFTGPQTITYVTPNAYSVNVVVPQFTLASSTYTGTTPPAGFVDPITHGSMSDSTTLGGDADNASVATLDMTLDAGERVIVSKSFVETNMLPFVDASSDKNYFGVPKTTADWASVDLHTDFDAVARIEWQSGDRHKLSQTVGDSANANHTMINSSTVSFYAYAVEFDGTDLHIIAHSDEAALSTTYGVSAGGSFDRVFTYSGYSAVRANNLPVVFATKTGGEMGLSTSGFSKIAIPASPGDQLNSQINFAPTYAFESASHDNVYETYSSGDVAYDDFGIDEIGLTSSFLTVKFKDSTAMSEFRNGSSTIEFIADDGSDPTWEGTFDLDSAAEYSVEHAFDYVLYQPTGQTTQNRADMADLAATAGVGVNVLDFSITSTTPLTTPWTKAIDFSGSNERMQQEGGGTEHNNPLFLPTGITVSEHGADTTLTTNDSDGRPWATAVVFKSDGNASNQHIWNHGEGQNGDNIYLRVNSSGELSFGWGIDGGSNEVVIAPSINSGTWYGVYVAHKGARFSSGDATAANLANSFEVYLASSADSFATLSSDLSIEANWTTTGNRMNRSIAGNTFLGGRDSNRSFNGKVAAFVATSLRQSVSLPSEAEALQMIRDPQQWLVDYKIGNSYRATGENYNNAKLPAERHRRGP